MSKYPFPRIVTKLPRPKGLILLGCGPNSIRFAPALIVNKDHIDCCVEIVENIIKEISRKTRKRSGKSDNRLGRKR